MKLSILVPVYNEIRTLPIVLEKLKAVPLEKEILLVDDASRDGTREWLQALALRSPEETLRVFFHGKNRGKGACLLTAIPHLRGEIALIQDADLEYDPAHIPELVEPILRKEADVVYGSRFLSPESVTFSRLYVLGNKFLTHCINLLWGTRFTDSYTCYKALPREILQSLNLESCGFEIEAEISCKIAARKLRIREVPIAYMARSRQEGKKINWKDAVKGLATILKIWRTSR